MGKIILGSFKEQYQENKRQLIKSKKGKIVSLQLIEDLKTKKDVIDIDIELYFEVEKSIQKIIFNQGILLPYKFSKFVEKAKFNLFHARQIDAISEEELNILFFALNLLINNEIRDLLVENCKVKSNWDISKISLN